MISKVHDPSRSHTSKSRVPVEFFRFKSYIVFLVKLFTAWMALSTHMSHASLISLHSRRYLRILVSWVEEDDRTCSMELDMSHREHRETLMWMYSELIIWRSVLSFNICNVRWLHSYGGARYRVPAQLYRRIDVSRFVEFFLKIISILHGARSQSVRFVECQIINVICVINCVWRNIWDKSRLYLATKAL